MVSPGVVTAFRLPLSRLIPCIDGHTVLHEETVQHLGCIGQCI
jgi:hypothetical protein